MRRQVMRDEEVERLMMSMMIIRHAWVDVGALVMATVCVRRRGVQANYDGSITEKQIDSYSP